MFYWIDSQLLNSVKKKTPLLALGAKKKEPPLVNVAAPQVKIFLIPSGAVLSPDGTVIATGAAPPQPGAAPNTISLAVPSPSQEGELILCPTCSKA